MVAVRLVRWDDERRVGGNRAGRVWLRQACAAWTPHGLIELTVNEPRRLVDAILLAPTVGPSRPPTLVNVAPATPRHSLRPPLLPAGRTNDHELRL